jgi:hypothetical protein
MRAVSSLENFLVLRSSPNFRFRSENLISTKKQGLWEKSTTDVFQNSQQYFIKNLAHDIVIEGF